MKTPLLTLIVIAASTRVLPAYANRPMPSDWRELQAKLDDRGVSNEEKIAFFQRHFGPERASDAAIWIKRVDPEAARRAAREAFAAERGSRDQKLRLGTLLLTYLGDPAFIEVYAPFLIDAVLNGGEQEFMRSRSENEVSAVGEYAFIASDFNGMSSKHFAKIADKRVIPILIACLDAPDHTRAAGTDIGTAGESTGRNTQRQQIPVALAKLGATEAIPALSGTLDEHHDYWERFHSAYALAVLMETKDSHALRKTLEAHQDQRDNRLMLFGLGTGLVERGDEEGVALMSFRYSTYWGNEDFAAVLYMLEERLQVLERAKGVPVEAFFREALAYKPLRTLLMFDAASVTPPASLERVGPDGIRQKVTTGEGVLEAAGERIRKDYKRMLGMITARKLSALAPVIRETGEASADAEIRRASEEAVAALSR